MEDAKNLGKVPKKVDEAALADDPEGAEEAEAKEEMQKKALKNLTNRHLILLAIEIKVAQEEKKMSTLVKEKRTLQNLLMNSKSGT